MAVVLVAVESIPSEGDLGSWLMPETGKEEPEVTQRVGGPSTRAGVRGARGSGASEQHAGTGSGSRRGRLRQDRQGRRGPAPQRERGRGAPTPWTHSHSLRCTQHPVTADARRLSPAGAQSTCSRVREGQGGAAPAPVLEKTQTQGLTPGRPPGMLAGPQRHRCLGEQPRRPLRAPWGRERGRPAHPACRPKTHNCSLTHRQWANSHLPTGPQPLTSRPSVNEEAEPASRLPNQ